MSLQANSRKSVCHLTAVHPQNDIRIFQKECVSLAREGYDVSFVAVNATEGNEKGVRIINAPLFKNSRLQRMFSGVNAVLKQAEAVDADIYHLHDPELLRIALTLKKKGKIVVYDAHEDFPRQILAKHWIAAPLRTLMAALAERYENFIASKIDCVIAATPHIAKRFSQINVRAVDVNNYPFLHELYFSKQNRLVKKKELCYIGNITEKRGISQLVDALSMVAIDVRLNLAGDALPEFLKKLKVKKGWRRVNEMGFVGREKLAEVVGNSFAGMVTLLPTPNHLHSHPVKMFEYMSAGIPVIASDFPYWKNIIDQHQCGICVNPFRPDEIAKAINYLMDNPAHAEEMGRNGRNAVEKLYNWESEEKKLIAVYRKMADKL